MADASCNICLDQLNNPVSIPCGHLHCEKCLLDYIDGSSDAHKSTCPTCRTPFSLITPNFACIPKKYHEFILSTTRRVYFDVSPKTDYKNRISELESQVNKLERDKVLLRDQCDQSVASSRIHAVGQANALREAEGAKNSLEDLRRQLEEMTMKYNELKEENERMMHSIPYAESPINGTGVTPSFVPETPSQHHAMRPMRPLPTRQQFYPSHISSGTHELMQDPQAVLRKRPRLSEPGQEGHESTAGVDQTRRSTVPYSQAPTLSIPYNHLPSDEDRQVYSPHGHHISSNATYPQYPQSDSSPTTQIPRPQIYPDGSFTAIDNFHPYYRNTM